MTASDIHKLIQQISANYIGGAPPLKVQHLADELDIDKDLAANHIDSLATLGLVEYQDPEREVIVLTVSGKLAQLP